MYEEKKRIRINWVSLIVKLILFVILIIIILFIIKGCEKRNILKRNITKAEYTTDINSMKDAAFEYFTMDRLPKKVGASNKLSLREMLDQKLIIDFTNNGILCRIDDSYIQATKTSDENFALKINLDCNGISDYIVTTIENKENFCKLGNSCGNAETKTQTKAEETQKSETTTNSKQSSKKTVNNTSQSTNNPTTTQTTQIIKTFEISTPCTTCCPSCNQPDPTPTPTPSLSYITYYKHVKYSDWTKTVLTGENVETKIVKENYNDTCPTTQRKTMYATAVMSHHTLYNTTHSVNINISKYLKNVGSNYKVLSVSYFNNNDYNNYLNQSYKPLYIIGDTIQGDVCLSSFEHMKSASLTSANFVYSVGNLYTKNNIAYLPMSITYKNAKNVEPICNCATGEKVFFLPFKIELQYQVNKACTKTREVKYYRTVTYKWTTNIYEEGYIYTGISEQRSV